MVGLQVCPLQIDPLRSHISKTIREFEVLLALCKAAPKVKTVQSAQKLSRQLASYLSESHTQIYAASPYFRKIEPSPTEALSYNVSAALLALGINHDDVQPGVSEHIRAFLNTCAGASEKVISRVTPDDSAAIDDAIHTATLTIAILGFLDAAAAQANFWRSGGRLALIQRLRSLLSGPFLTAIETAFSTIRNSQSDDRHVKEWKRYLRHYADIGRPLGAMLLQRSFMCLLVAVTSLLVAELDALKTSHVLDILMSGDGLLRPLTARTGDVDFRSVETYANVVIDLMNYLDSSADFVRLGSSAQQKIACSVKASALISYLNCSRLNEDAADADVLMGWLEDTLADPLSMADDELAAVVLKSMALLCRVSPTYAASVSRLLPRFIVQSFAKSQTVEVASKSLAFVLQMLSPDAVITTLYTLGNVLSPGNERTLTNGVNGDTADGAENHVYAGRQSTGSSISLQISGEEDQSTVHSNVVQAICGIAIACKDEKMTALAQSMLLQKIDKVTSSVDARIITAAATLALSGGPLEFRSLLKMYGRLSHFAAVENKEAILVAVSCALVDSLHSNVLLTTGRFLKLGTISRLTCIAIHPCTKFTGSTC
jgi:phosphatidylinositol 4-kinase